VIKKQLILLFIVYLMFPLGLLAKEKRGAELLVKKTDGITVRGELITVKKHALLLLSSEGPEVTVHIEDVETIQIKKKSKMLLGGAVGSTAGILGGALVFNDMWYSDHGDLSKSEASLRSSLFFGSVGLLLGGMTGAYAGRDVTHPVAEYHQAEKDVLLRKLLKQARVPEFQ
jgi:hypothetical protein